MKKIIFLFIAFSLVLSISSCNNSKKMMGENALLDGSWELVYLNAAENSFAGLYPEKIPTMVINTASKTISGTTGCNRYSTALNISNNKIDLTAPIVATKMMCMNSAKGESLFLGLLPQVSTFAISQGELYLMKGDTTVMRFKKS